MLLKLKMQVINSAG